MLAVAEREGSVTPRPVVATSFIRLYRAEILVSIAEMMADV